MLFHDVGKIPKSSLIQFNLSCGAARKGCGPHVKLYDPNSHPTGHKSAEGLVFPSNVGMAQSSPALLMCGATFSLLSCSADT